MCVYVCALACSKGLQSSLIKHNGGDVLDTSLSFFRPPQPQLVFLSVASHQLLREFISKHTKSEMEVTALLQLYNSSK